MCRHEDFIVDIYNTWVEIIHIKKTGFINTAMLFLDVKTLVKIYLCCFCYKYMLYFISGGTLVFREL